MHLGPGVDDIHARSLRAALITGETLEVTDPGESEDVGVDWGDPRALTSFGEREPTEPELARPEGCTAASSIGFHAATATPSTTTAQPARAVHFDTGASRAPTGAGDSAMAARSISASARQVSPDTMIWAAMVIFPSAWLASGFLPSVYRQNALSMHAGHLGSGHANGCPTDRIGNDRELPGDMPGCGQRLPSWPGRRRAVGLAGLLPGHAVTKQARWASELSWRSGENGGN